MFIHDHHTRLEVDSAKPILSKNHWLAIDRLIPISMDVDADDACLFFYNFNSSSPRYISNVSYSNFSQLPHLLAKSNFVHKSNLDTPRGNGPHPLRNASSSSATKVG